MILDRVSPRKVESGQQEFFRFDLERDTLLSADYAISVLTDDEKQRAAGFHFDRHRDRFVQGRAVLRVILSELLACDATEISLPVGPYGKPQVGGHGLHFNLSHSAYDAVLAWSREGPVGIDIERHDRQAEVDRLANHVFTPFERDVLGALTDSDKRKRFFDFWTAKEARMKLTGEGMSLPPDRISLHLIDGRAVGYDTPVTPLAQLRMLDLGADVSCALVSLAPSA